jgi:polyhydroxybutyrate depolymerase
MAMRTEFTRRNGLAAAVLVLVVATAACVAPPTAPGPSVLPQAPGRGKVPGQAVAPSSGCVNASAPALPAGTSTLDIPWQGGTRTAILNVPTSPTTTPRPVLVSLHPFALGPEAWEAYSGLAAAAVARGDVVLTPLGSDPGPRWAVPGGLATEADDIGFVNALLDRVEDRSCVDRNREFAAGFSAGAAMAQALSCTVPWRLAAVAGSGGTNLTDLCPDSPGIDTLVLHGTADPIAAPTGSTVIFAPPLGLAVADVVATDAARAGCAPVPVLSQPYPSVTQETYPGCTEHRRVEYRKMLGAGHTWAGAPNPIIELVGGPTNLDFSATTAVLDFFDGVHTVVS